MIDHLEALKQYAAWVRGDAETFDTSVGLFQAVDLAVEEIEKLRIYEKSRIDTIQKWAAERVEMVAEIERLRKLATCGCGDEFTEHDTGTCGNCLAAKTAVFNLEIERLKRGECICTKCGLRQNGVGVVGEF